MPALARPQATSRSTALRAALVVMILTSGLGACGGDAPPPSEPDAAPEVDARSDAGDISLGLTCEYNDECPGDVCMHTAGSAFGYCSSMCDETADCSDGYHGPAGGQPDCRSGFCRIRCSSTADCPSNTGCDHGTCIP